jgi:phosphoribosylamine--glycine ligase
VALTVVMAAKGYPGTPEKGTEIRGLDAAGEVEGVEIFHAGTKAVLPSARQASQKAVPLSARQASLEGADAPSLRSGAKIVADGGRVLNVTARGRTVAEAQARAYEAISKIDWPGGFCRKDIGWRAVAREKA